MKRTAWRCGMGQSGRLPPLSDCKFPQPPGPAVLPSSDWCGSGGRAALSPLRLSRCCRCACCCPDCSAGASLDPGGGLLTNLARFRMAAFDAWLRAFHRLRALHRAAIRGLQPAGRHVARSTASRGARPTALHDVRLAPGAPQADSTHAHAPARGPRGVYRHAGGVALTLDAIALTLALRGRVALQCLDRRARTDFARFIPPERFTAHALHTLRRTALDGLTIACRLAACRFAEGDPAFRGYSAVLTARA